MRAHHPSPSRGLLAGLLALTTFASAAVAMTAGGSNSQTTPPQATQAAVAPVVRQADTTRRFDGDGARFDGRDGGGRGDGEGGRGR
jgi:hypothetical protein